MRRWAETLAFVALAVLLHLGLVLRLPVEEGAEAGGQGGASMVTLAAATPQLAALVAEWDRPPETSAPPEAAQPAPAEVEPPPAPAPAAEAPPQRTPMATLPETPAAEPAMPQAFSMPAPRRGPAPQALPQAPDPGLSAVSRPPPPAAAATPRRMALARPEAQPAPDRPAVDTARPAPPREDRQGPPLRSRRPAQRPEGLAPGKRSSPEPVRRADRQEPRQARGAAQQTSAAATAQRASGAGGREQAGQRQSAATKTLSKARQQSLVAAWGGQIRARIERQKRFPRGTRGSGRVVLRITVTPDGRIAGAGIARSSGQAAFDQAAMTAVRRAGRVPRAPAGLSQSSYAFNLPMDFR